LTTPAPAPPDSYLRAILALPGDDGPRLCAADWWDEQGAAERAEFVRVQCELAALDAEALTCESEDRAAAITTRTALLRRRERELAVHCAAWAGTDGVMKALGADRVRRLGLSMAFTDLEFSLDGRPSGKVSGKKLLALLELQGRCCALSGIELTPQTVSLDHIVPLAEGGADDMGNVQLVHAIINSMKGLMSQTDFVKWCKLVSDRHS
jgi:uncharacterized protein (TIGR02996 family)